MTSTSELCDADKQNISDILRDIGIRHYIINNDGVVDIFGGGVSLDKLELTHFPIRFGRIDGYFRCIDNELTSLKGGPHTVTGDFRCSHNYLTDLQYRPITVGGNFYCDSNFEMFDILKHIFKTQFTLGGRFFGPMSSGMRSDVLDNIINKHLPSKDILSCVDELLDSGFEEYTIGLKR